VQREFSEGAKALNTDKAFFMRLDLKPNLTHDFTQKGFLPYCPHFPSRCRGDETDDSACMILVRIEMFFN